MIKPIIDGYTRIRNRIKYLAFGLAFGTGAMFLGQGGCIASGDCFSCGACAAKLPFLVLPILTDSAIMLFGGVKDKQTIIEEPDAIIINGETKK